MTHTGFTLFIWAFADGGITTSNNSMVTPSFKLFGTCLTEPSIDFLTTPKSFELLIADLQNRDSRWPSSSRLRWKTYAPRCTWFILISTNVRHSATIPRAPPAPRRGLPCCLLGRSRRTQRATGVVRTRPELRRALLGCNQCAL